MPARPRPGQTLDEFDLSGHRVVFRTPRRADARGLMLSINRLVAERAHIAVQKRKTLKAEKEWLSGLLRALAHGTQIPVVAEVDGEVAGLGTVTAHTMDATRHVARLDIGLSLHRDKGLGTRMVKLLLALARSRLGVRVVVLDVFAPNARAIRCYQKAGFRECGRVPKAYSHYGRCVDQVIMARKL